MAIKAILDTLEGVDEANQAFYAEDGGKFVLDVDKYSAAQVSAAVDKETSGLKANLDDLKADLTANPAIMRLTRGTDASGGGAATPNGRAGTSAKSWAEAKTAKEKAEFLKQKKAS
ncbi:hypothetical protein [Ruegeria jejuensis]|uniref:hypothetical protein n=1 Tax=Ruegeria jejuensis TaxID=3233338 RepID=UPI00355C7590